MLLCISGVMSDSNVQVIVFDSGLDTCDKFHIAKASQPHTLK
jgi:hypothetical protein